MDAESPVVTTLNVAENSESNDADTANMMDGSNLVVNSVVEGIIDARYHDGNFVDLTIGYCNINNK